MTVDRAYKGAWEGPLMLPDGHRLFTVPGVSPRHVAIADDSGGFPEECEGGVLWLDMSRPLMIQGTYVGIPLVDREGKETRTPSNAETILSLAATYGWEINSGVVNLRVQQASYFTVHDAPRQFGIALGIMRERAERYKADANTYEEMAANSLAENDLLEVLRAKQGAKELMRAHEEARYAVASLQTLARQCDVKLPEESA